MTTALYRRYRPESFGEMIGQSQVTEPLMTALRGDRVGHAYLFSGPRGCGKTTSARILARCLNCAEGPTDVPCGTCPSCVELSRAGGGSLDVVEIDAASHNGVDDARDLRERATFAPSRDRYKIFILDEAHMVTPQGFNALLKLVEEPPEHVKFIFATTEPEKVLGTIRSRTHHYPFRLVPPAAMLEYVEKLCTEEGVVAERGVLPLVVRAGGGSPRDTLSLLDQLIAGSDSPAGSETVTVAYERAVALLGYTHAALLDEIVDALAAADAAAAFPAIDRVVQTGQDPRRFVDDLLERLRDLIVIAAVGAGASSVLRGLAEDDLTRMRAQAESFGSARLSRTADVVSAALDDMSGATSPRLHLELMVARVLAAATAVAAPATPATAGAASAPARQTPSATEQAKPSVTEQAKPSVTEQAKPSVTEQAKPSVTDRGGAAVAEATPLSDAGDGTAGAATPESESPESESPEPESPAADTTAAPAPASVASAPAAAPAGPVSFEDLTAAWPAILKRLEDVSRTSWLLATAVQPLAFVAETEVLTLGFASQHDVAKFKGTTPGSGPSDHLRSAIEQQLGVRVKYLPAPMPAGGAPRQPATPAAGRPSADAPASEPASARPPRTQTPAASTGPVTEWAVAAIPASVDAAPAAPAARTSTAVAAPVAPAEQIEAVAPVDPAIPATPASPMSGSTAPSVDGPAPSDEPPYPVDEEPPYFDDEPPYDPSYEPAPSGPTPARAQNSAPASPRSATASDAPVQVTGSPVRTVAAAAPAPVITERAPGGGVQRYGEAVIRQVLGATFVREEPYEPPTRFS
ncbi:DNA polymerase III subunit gamma and tau [Microbacterium sp. ANT_H45B]|uniref:DNA polymerase III subunit gamma and tau n=1 Tax=Microbacterium sp. ANT_H45B TaxID=2597346 RepID=UPI00165E1A2A|nr:DNA polymerase III subunit gamma and tau [Microbacterium sp. ANT_H45B]